MVLATTAPNRRAFVQWCLQTVRNPASVPLELDARGRASAQRCERAIHAATPAREGHVAGPNLLMAIAAAALAHRAASRASCPLASSAMKTPLWTSPAPVVST